MTEDQTLTCQVCGSRRMWLMGCSFTIAEQGQLISASVFGVRIYAVDNDDDPRSMFRARVMCENGHVVDLRLNVVDGGVEHSTALLDKQAVDGLKPFSR
jgi:hypothetical protein